MAISQHYRKFFKPKAIQLGEKIIQKVYDTAKQENADKTYIYNPKLTDKTFGKFLKRKRFNKVAPIQLAKLNPEEKAKRDTLDMNE